MYLKEGTSMIDVYLKDQEDNTVTVSKGRLVDISEGIVTIKDATGVPVGQFNLADIYGWSEADPEDTD